MSKSKKIISFFLAIIFVLCSNVTTFATDCDHSNYRKVYKDLVSSTCDEFLCNEVWLCREICLECYYQFEPYYDINNRGHNFNFYKATCDGTTQTWYYRCTHGGYEKRTYKTCRLGPHTGSCAALPLSFISHEIV